MPGLFLVQYPVHGTLLLLFLWSPLTERACVLLLTPALCRALSVCQVLRMAETRIRQMLERNSTQQSPNYYLIIICHAGKAKHTVPYIIGTGQKGHIGDQVDDLLVSQCLKRDKRSQVR